MTLDELDAARMWMSVLGRTNSRERISSLLILILEHQSRLNRTPVGEAADFSLPITREEAADFLGLTLETVSRRLSDLKSEGIIEFGGVRRIHIPCLESLLSETGDPAVWRDRLSRANA